MLDHIEVQTEKLKMSLIQLGFVLTPSIQIHANKLTQINADFQEISDILIHSHSTTLFENVGHVTTALTTSLKPVQTLADVLTSCSYCINYVEDYLK
jgi:hypothetical protein